MSYFIRELCICIDSGYFPIQTSTDMSQLLEYICTIIIIMLFYILLYIDYNGA